MSVFKHALAILYKAFEWTVLGLALVLFVVMASPVLPTKNFFASYAVVTGSMEPTVPVGALAVVQAQPATSLQTNDIIAFSEPGNPQRVILHRIAEVMPLGDKRSFRTKGDNNNASDAWMVSDTMVKGKLSYTIPQLGRIIMFAQQPLGFGLLIGIPAGLSIMANVFKIREGIEEEIGRRTNLALAKHQVVPVKQE